MDESRSQVIDSKNTVISSLTGVLVPTHKYAELRTKFYDLLEWSIKSEPNAINMAVPELHGRELLPGEDDEKKLKIFEGVVDLVVRNRLEIYRVGYYITKTIRKTFKGDEEMLGRLWLEILNSLRPKIENEMIIPVMDGFDRNMVRKFSQLVKGMDVIRAAGHEHCISLKYSENILGEVFYADSHYSVFTQVADLVSWLRQLSDISREGKRLTPYKKRLLVVSEKLKPAIVCDEVIAMELNGKTQGPCKEVMVDKNR
jgi:hypothetical protein